MYFLKQSLVKKSKCLTLGTKMPYLGVFGLELEKSIVVFEINLLKVF